MHFFLRSHFHLIFGLLSVYFRANYLITYLRHITETAIREHLSGVENGGGQLRMAILMQFDVFWLMFYEHRFYVFVYPKI